MLPWTGYQGPTSPKLVIMTAWVSFFAFRNLVPDRISGARSPFFEVFFQGCQSFCSALIFKYLSMS